MATTPTALPTRRLGKTDLAVSIIGFGGIPIMGVSEEDAIAAVRHAQDVGISFFDTARSYRTSEERMGAALEGRRCVVATKSDARDAAGIREAVDISLRNLGRDTIDLYQLHGVNSEEELGTVLASDGALEGLRHARTEGKIGHIGITGHRPSVLIEALEQRDEFETVQVPFNVVESNILEDLVPLCVERDIGLIAMKPVGGGNFSNAPLAIKWCLNQPNTVPIPGMSRIQEVEQNAAVARGGLALTAAERAECERMKSELDHRTCRRCRYCEPCQNGVRIGALLMGRSIIRRVGPQRFRQWGAREIIASAQQCTECGECIAKCPYDLPIPELIREAVAYYETISDLAED